MNYSVIGITEHDCVSNVIKIEKIYKKVKDKYPELKIVYGNEIYLCKDGLDSTNIVAGEDKFWHFILYALDEVGHKQIRELSTRAWTRSFVYRGMRRVPTYYQDLVEIIQSNPGHVAASSACLGSFLDNKLLQYHVDKNPDLYSKIVNWCYYIESIFGKGNFYLELQPAASKEQKIANKELINLANYINFPYIITTDAHYLKKEDAPIHKAFLNSQDGDREVDDFYATTYLMGTEELESYLDLTKEELEKAYNSILEIRNKVKEFTLSKPLRIPELLWKKCDFIIPNEYYELMPYLKIFSESDYLGDRHLAKIVAERIYFDKTLQNELTYNEINQNLETTWISSKVNNAHWSAYFLNLQQIIEVCWEAGSLVGPGRGSGVGFLLLYVLGITQINPLREETKCFAWRFLNPDRVSVLDIDIDIEGSKRATVLSKLKEVYGLDKVVNVATFGTEKSKSAILTACRGLGIEVDEAQYLSSLIPADRGQLRSLKECYYGSEEKGFPPVSAFVAEMSTNYVEVWEVAQKIENLVNKIGEHAGGVIFTDGNFVDSTALMRAPNGDLITQFDLHDAEEVSLIKYDLLSIEGLDKIHITLNLLAEHNYIQQEPTLKETYEKVVGIYNLERTDINMWKKIWNHEILSLFQMEKQSGIQGIALAKPKSVNELAVLNSVIRLMAPDKGGEQPLEMWARYRKDINQWYQEMKEYGLTTEEIEWLSGHSAITDGICESQEGLMSLVQEPRLGGNSLTFADKCRKGLAKKIGSLFDECEQEFFKNIKEKNCSVNLAHYVWDVLLRVQRGYSFNRSHCLAYSLIALQEMNLCFRYPDIFWNCACLINDSGGSEEESSSANYDKIAAAIGKIQSSGVVVMPPNINKSNYIFAPDVEKNLLLFGLRGINGVGSEVIQRIIDNRPYYSVKDFYVRVKPDKSSMISLIKSGAFDEFDNRKFIMAWYIWEICDKKKNLTLSNMSSIIKYGFLPEDNKQIVNAKKVYEFNRYLKAECKYTSTYYKLDERTLGFLSRFNLIHLIEFNDGINMLSIKSWDKVYQKWMDIIREWITANKEIILSKLNDNIFKEEWNKYALGSLSTWEMESICLYYHDHELKNVNMNKYGFSNFHNLPTSPIVDTHITRKGKTIPIFKLHRICGTCIAKDNNKGTVTLLTTTGVVTIRFRKEYFSLFNKQVSEKRADGTKKVLEKSWFGRGNMIVVTGIRSGEEFISKKYQSTGGHQLYKIDQILDNGDLILKDHRETGELEEE